MSSRPTAAAARTRQGRAHALRLAAPRRVRLAAANPDETSFPTGMGDTATLQHDATSAPASPARSSLVIMTVRWQRQISASQQLNPQCACAATLHPLIAHVPTSALQPRSATCVLETCMSGELGGAIVSTLPRSSSGAVPSPDENGFATGMSEASSARHTTAGQGCTQNRHHVCEHLAVSSVQEGTSVAVTQVRIPQRSVISKWSSWFLQCRCPAGQPPQQPLRVRGRAHALRLAAPRRVRLAAANPDETSFPTGMGDTATLQHDATSAPASPARSSLVIMTVRWQRQISASQQLNPQCACAATLHPLIALVPTSALQPRSATCVLETCMSGELGGAIVSTLPRSSSGAVPSPDENGFATGMSEASSARHTTAGQGCTQYRHHVCEHLSTSAACRKAHLWQ